MEKVNTAQLLLAALGVATVGAPKSAHGNKEASATKRGTGRFALHGKPGNRLAKPRKTRAYRALLDAWADRRFVHWEGRRDEHGNVTLTGGRDPVTGAKRVWLGGISAQRGY